MFGSSDREVLNMKEAENAVAEKCSKLPESRIGLSFAQNINTVTEDTETAYPQASFPPTHVTGDVSSVSLCHITDCAVNCDKTVTIKSSSVALKLENSKDPNCTNILPNFNEVEHKSCDLNNALKANDANNGILLNISMPKDKKLKEENGVGDDSESNDDIHLSPYNFGNSEKNNGISCLPVKTIRPQYYSGMNEEEECSISSRRKFVKEKLCDSGEELYRPKSIICKEELCKSGQELYLSEPIIGKEELCKSDKELGLCTCKTTIYKDKLYESGEELYSPKSTPCKEEFCESGEKLYLSKPTIGKEDLYKSEELCSPKSTTCKEELCRSGEELCLSNTIIYKEELYESKEEKLLNSRELYLSEPTIGKENSFESREKLCRPKSTVSKENLCESGEGLIKPFLSKEEFRKLEENLYGTNIVKEELRESEELCQTIIGKELMESVDLYKSGGRKEESVEELGSNSNGEEVVGVVGEEVDISGIGKLEEPTTALYNSNNANEKLRESPLNELVIRKESFEEFYMPTTTTTSKEVLKVLEEEVDASQIGKEKFRESAEDIPSNGSEEPTESAAELPSNSKGSEELKESAEKLPSHGNGSEEPTESARELRSPSNSSEELRKSAKELPSPSNSSEEIMESAEEIPSPGNGIEEPTESARELPSPSNSSEELRESVKELPSQSNGSEELRKSAEEMPSPSNGSEEPTESAKELPSSSNGSKELRKSAEEIPSHSNGIEEPTELARELPSPSNSSEELRESAKELPSPSNGTEELRKSAEEMPSPSNGSEEPTESAKELPSPSNGSKEIRKSAEEIPSHSNGSEEPIESAKELPSPSNGSEELRKSAEEMPSPSNGSEEPTESAKELHIPSNGHEELRESAEEILSPSNGIEEPTESARELLSPSNGHEEPRKSAEEIPNPSNGSEEPAESARELPSPSNGSEELMESAEEIPSPSNGSEELRKSAEEMPSPSNGSEEPTESAKELPSPSNGSKELRKSAEEMPSPSNGSEEPTESARELPSPSNGSEELMESAEEIPSHINGSEELRKSAEEIPSHSNCSEDLRESDKDLCSNCIGQEALRESGEELYSADSSVLYDENRRKMEEDIYDERVEEKCHSPNSQIVKFVDDIYQVPKNPIFNGDSAMLKRSSLKRKAEGDGNGPKRKRIQFDGVTVFYFPRSQGFTCVPSQGGSTLGMSRRHFSIKNFSLAEHAAEQRKGHRDYLLKLRQQRANQEKHEMGSQCSSSEDSEEQSEEQSDISDSELESDSFYFLQPLPIRQRRALLRQAGIRQIEGLEKDECKDIRISREMCGCQCKIFCDRSTCQCSHAGIKCQVDRHSFPCGCTRDGCRNPNGRIEFNPIRVRTHFLHTLMRLELEKRQNQTNQNSNWGCSSLTKTSYWFQNGSGSYSSHPFSVANGAGMSGSLPFSSAHETTLPSSCGSEIHPCGSGVSMLYPSSFEQRQLNSGVAGTSLFPIDGGEEYCTGGSSVFSESVMSPFDAVIPTYGGSMSSFPSQGNLTSSSSYHSKLCSPTHFNISSLSYSAATAAVVVVSPGSCPYSLQSSFGSCDSSGSNNASNCVAFDKFSSAVASQMGGLQQEFSGYENTASNNARSAKMNALSLCDMLTDLGDSSRLHGSMQPSFAHCTVNCDITDSNSSCLELPNSSQSSHNNESFKRHSSLCDPFSFVSSSNPSAPDSLSAFDSTYMANSSADDSCVSEGNTSQAHLYNGCFPSGTLVDTPLEYSSNNTSSLTPPGIVGTPASSDCKTNISSDLNKFSCSNLLDCKASQFYQSFDTYSGNDTFSGDTSDDARKPIWRMEEKAKKSLEKRSNFSVDASECFFKSLNASICDVGKAYQVKLSTAVDNSDCSTLKCEDILDTATKSICTGILQNKISTINSFDIDNLSDSTSGSDAGEDLSTNDEMSDANFKLERFSDDDRRTDCPFMLSSPDLVSTSKDCHSISSFRNHKFLGNVEVADTELVTEEPPLTEKKHESPSAVETPDTLIKNSSKNCHKPNILLENEITCTLEKEEKSSLDPEDSLADYKIPPLLTNGTYEDKAETCSINSIQRDCQDQLITKRSENFPTSDKFEELISSNNCQNQPATNCELLLNTVNGYRAQEQMKSTSVEKLDSEKEVSNNSLEILNHLEEFEGFPPSEGSQVKLNTLKRSIEEVGTDAGRSNAWYRFKRLKENKDLHENESSMQIFKKDPTEIICAFENDSSMQVVIKDPPEITSAFENDSSMQVVIKDPPEITSAFQNDSSMQVVIKDPTEINSAFKNDSRMQVVIKDPPEITSAFENDSSMQVVIKDPTEITSAFRNDSSMQVVIKDQPQITSAFEDDSRMQVVIKDPPETKPSDMEDSLRKQIVPENSYVEAGNAKAVLSPTETISDRGRLNNCSPARAQDESRAFNNTKTHIFITNNIESSCDKNTLNEVQPLSV